MTHSVTLRAARISGQHTLRPPLHTTDHRWRLHLLGAQPLAGRPLLLLLALFAALQLRLVLALRRLQLGVVLPQQLLSLLVKAARLLIIRQLRLQNGGVGQIGPEEEAD